VPRRKLFRIFKKAACPSCNGEIERFTLANRKVFACPVCQTSASATRHPSSAVDAAGGVTRRPRRSSPARRRG
jgi:hypothetical protein